MLQPQCIAATYIDLREKAAQNRNELWLGFDQEQPLCRNATRQKGASDRPRAGSQFDNQTGPPDIHLVSDGP